jgi:hypothetical protein
MVWLKSNIGIPAPEQLSPRSANEAPTSAVNKPLTMAFVRCIASRDPLVACQMRQNREMSGT